MAIAIDTGEQKKLRQKVRENEKKGEDERI